MDEFFHSAFCVRPPRVLGMQLKPFSLGHWVVLEHLGSTWLEQGATITKPCLIQAVWVCSRLATDIGDEHPRLTARIWRNLVRRAKRCDFEAEKTVFDCYLSSYARRPEVWTSGDGAGRIGSPAPYAIAWAMMQYGHQNYKDAWNMPVCMANALYSVCGEYHGTSQVVTDEERAAIAALPDEEQHAG